MNQNHSITRQTTITPYLCGTMSKFDNINEPIMDQELTTQERIEIFKTLAYNFFDDNTFFLSYAIKINKIPPFDFVCAQFGFINCKNIEEKYNLLMVYKTVFEKCYPDLFVFKPLQLLHEYFCQDKIADFIIESYSRIQYTDSYFYWFFENQHIVKHNLDYYSHMEKKRALFKKSVTFSK